MYAHHEEASVDVPASAEHVFAHLDDQRRLSAHMSKRSWRMGWGKMETMLDALGGRAVGSHIAFRGRVFGLAVGLDEVVTAREAPVRKVWETTEQPRLLVIGPCRMGFELTPRDSGVVVRVAIDYDLPVSGVPRLLGRMFGRMYAQWCVRTMAHDAHKAIAA